MTVISPRPLILIRGFGNLDISDEQRNAYQGFNDGSVYPGKRGEDYIYEGFLLRALKSARYPYTDATNVVGYYAQQVPADEPPAGYLPEELSGTVVIDPPTEQRVLANGTRGSIWVYRYYDLTPRAMQTYGEGLVTLIRLIRRSAVRRGETFDGVDVVAHSMGGLVLREALRAMRDEEGGPAENLVHRIVTLGTPHRGIAFQYVPDWLLAVIPTRKEKDADDELGAFNPHKTDFTDLGGFPVERLLTVVGTNFRSYGTKVASWGNRLASLLDDGSLEYNRSDGLVKQASAQVPGAPRTFVHKCHGGQDSLVTSREAYEISMRFFHGTHSVSLWLKDAEILRGRDWFGRSEFYFGASVKPRGVDFDLFHQSPEAENLYGPFNKSDLSDDLPDLAQELTKPLSDRGDATTGWAGQDRLIWQGWVDAEIPKDSASTGMVFRLDLYLGERDRLGFGFTDNAVFRKQYYIQAFPPTEQQEMELFVHTGEDFLRLEKPTDRADLARQAEEKADATVQRLVRDGDAWTFRVGGTGFRGVLRLAITPV